MLKKAADFIKNCRGKSVIVYDTDGDGIGAAVILAKTMKRLAKKYPRVIPKDRGLSLISDNIIEKVRGFDNIIFLDIAADERAGDVTRIAKKSRIMVLDHHQARKDLNKSGILHVNPFLFQKKLPSSSYCTSKLAFDICSTLEDVGGLDWIAAMGMVNDKAEKVWKGFMKRVYKKYGISAGNFKKVNDIVTSSYMFSKKAYFAASFKACMESEKPQDILKGRNAHSKKLLRLYNAVEKEIMSVMKRWDKTAEVFSDKKVIILELKTKLSISSVVSTIISLKKPHYTVFVAKIDGKFVSVSLRRQDGKVNCGLLARKLTENIRNSSGGGHIPAAGIKIMRSDWKKIRKRILEIL